MSQCGILTGLDWAQCSDASGLPIVHHMAMEGGGVMARRLHRET